MRLKDRKSAGFHKIYSVHRLSGRHFVYVLKKHFEPKLQQELEIKYGKLLRILLPELPVRGARGAHLGAAARAEGGPGLETRAGAAGDRGHALLGIHCQVPG